MRSFLEWVSDSSDFQAWQELNDHLLKRHKGPSNLDYYERLVALLRKTGLDEEADELMMVMPTQEELDFGRQPMGNTWRKNNAYSAMYGAVSSHLRNIEELVEKKYEEMGWSF